MGTDKVEKEAHTNLQHLVTAYDEWFTVPVSGFRPSARYKHAAEVVDGKLYVTGGSRNGRHLSDIQVFDLRAFTWSVVKPHFTGNHDKRMDDGTQEVVPASSGHSLVKWGNKLLLIAGHLKEPSDFVTVRFIDTETHNCNVVETSGKVPVARGGQSATVVGSKLIMLGGEGKLRQLFNDLHVLDLDTMTWSEVKTMQTPPAPRFDHVAAVNAERYLLVFGGSSHSTCFNDLHVLDLQTMEWSQPQIQGEVVTARAGHAGAIIEKNWYIVGGGDNRSAALDTLVLNMSKLAWSEVTSVQGRNPLASEGLSLCSATVNDEKFLVAFGGYNGNYNNEVFVLKPKPREPSRPKIFQSPAAAAAAASVTAAYAMSTSALKSLDFVNEKSATVFKVDASDALKAEKQQLESDLSEVRIENSRLKGYIDEVNNTHTELTKELLSVQGQLAAEISRCYKLEAQISEFRTRLESLNSIEHELQVLRQQKSTSEEFVGGGSQDAQGSRGVWQWIAGSSP
ncbi:acyl-CoA-binding domain-containing protein 4 [Aristolochia californica]|uniref:acyl-CoA-binding domain-containing protein 4 n=1 Tax=Aristolochia californica TaxID=171875 RepID=UPI0035DEEF35